MISENASIFSSTEMSSTGVKTTILANSYFCVTATASYSFSIPFRIYIANALNGYALSDSGETTYAIQLEISYCNVTTEDITLVVFAQYQTAAQNGIRLTGFYVN